MEQAKVFFSFDNKVYETPKGVLLSKVCSDAGYAQDLVCGGNGKCGKCAVEIEIGGEAQTVLSCQYEIESDITVKHIMNRAGRKVNVLTANMALNCFINPMLQVLHVNRADITAQHCGSFMSALKDKFKLTASLESERKLSYYFAEHAAGQALFVIYKNKIIDVLPDDEPVYGLAADIGSTTVAVYIYDIATAKLAGTYSSLNGQTAFGADVISRIGYCIKNEDGLQTMRQKVSDTLNFCLEEAKTKDHIDTSRIYHAVFCGNSTMQHLFLGFYPEALGKAPFVSTTHALKELKGRDTLLDINENAAVTFLPLLGGFVGADTTAVLIGLPDDEKPRLAIDLGTNGELAVGTKERYLVASTACGPALEGAGLTCGMRAAAGAIEHFTLDRKTGGVLQVIGNEKPTGICGSGIIDILAQLLKNNVINQRGQMMSREKYVAKYGEDKISERLVKYENEEKGEINAYLLAGAEESGSAQPIYFSQLDAREVQKAKAAIAAGCKILIRNYGRQFGIEPEGLAEICLAGAFGNYLDVKNAQYIGLFPDIEGVKVRSVGNGAGTGVQMFLLDKTAVRLCATVQTNAEHIELNFQDGFMDTYFDEMLFKNAK